jgi:RNA polymerase sigma factor (sigma-70 family)
MPDLIFDSVILQDCLDRWRDGDKAAANDLVKMVIVRLEKLARRMFRSFPNVRGTADTDDVLQNSLMRLLRSLKRIKPTTTRDFFNLAAVQIRWELIDLARVAHRRNTIQFDLACTDEGGPVEPLSQGTNDVEQWVLFHNAIDKLPEAEREVVSLMFYHGWSQRQIAEVLNVADRTVRRRWSRACKRLKEMIGKDFLEP